MAWTANPFFTARRQETPDPEASTPITEGVREGFLNPSEKITGHQIFYLLVPHGFIAAIISGVINFAIAVGMLRTLEPQANCIPGLVV